MGEPISSARRRPRGEPVFSKSTSRRIARLREDEGQALVEYALILMLVALVSIGVLSTIGTTIRGIFEAVVAGL